MISGVVILTVYFSLEFRFVRELVTLGKCDEFLFHKEIKDFFSLCHIKCQACVLETCDFFPRPGGGGDSITSWRICCPLLTPTLKGRYMVPPRAFSRRNWFIINSKLGS